VDLGADGRLRADTNPKTMMRQLFDGALIDTLYGAVTYRDGATRFCSLVRPRPGVQMGRTVLAGEQDTRRTGTVTPCSRLISTMAGADGT